jgi:hypothetical protein
VSTESIASSSLSVGGTESCASCGAALADDQRYCLECGERIAPISSVLLGGPSPGSNAQPAPLGPSAPGPPAAGHLPPDASGSRSGNTVTVIAGVGVLLLAMGVGVLIGRSGGSKQGAAPAQVISVGSSGAGAGTNAAVAPSFTDDWPAGTSGYTVQLQTLPQSGTLTSAVEAAKTAASAKRAKGVGALKSEDFSSLTAGSYVIYSGVYHKKAEAQKALGGLKKSFPGASVISVSNGGSHPSSEVAGGSGSGSGAGSSLSHPAPPSVVQSLSKKKGKSYEEESKNLPNVISTG